MSSDPSSERKNKRIVLDTSIFVNPASSRAFGESPTLAFTAFLEMAQLCEDVEFLMPPSIYAELMHFVEEARVPLSLRTVLSQQAPKKHEIRVPGIFIYQLVENMRDRVDRGLRLAERHVREALERPAAPVPTSERPQKPVRADAETISNLRESYRRIMREGVLDSRADVDLLLLAYELNGILVSADIGVLLWAENLGLHILPYDQLKVFMHKEPEA